MLNILIRRMTIDDVDQVYSIEQDSFPIPWSKESFFNDISNNKCARYLVACINNKIIAYCGIWIILDEGHITNLAVSTGFQSIGIGTYLFQSLIEYSVNLGVKYITLEVRKSNFIAQKLYKKLGFHKVSIRKNYYEDNREDAYIMVSEPKYTADAKFDECSFERIINIETRNEVS